MKEEVLAAVMFFVRFIEKSDKFPREQIENFKNYLTDLLIERFEKHWFPELPSKGQGYRCIRVNCLSPVDLTLEQAASKCGFTYNDLRLPTELTVWVDPNEVCYRLGESEGSYCTLATFNSDSSSESSNSPPTTPLHEKYRNNKIQKPFYQRYSIDFPSKYNFNNNNNMNSTLLRSTKTFREANWNCNQNRQMFRCDVPPFNVAPGFLRSITNYNRHHYKNILKV